MIPRWRNMLHLVRLTRMEVVLSAVGDSWLALLLYYRYEPASPAAAAVPTWPLWLALLMGGAVAGGLAVYGMAINDVVDARHDRTFSPQRPVAAGQVGWAWALMLAVGSMLVSMLAATFLGRESALLTILAAAAVLFYNTTGKYVPAVGIVLVGLIRAVNMLIPAPHLALLWPVWWTMTHSMACATMGHWLEGKRPRLRGPAAAALTLGWMFWTLALLLLMSLRGTLTIHSARLWLWPLGAALVFVLISTRLLRGPGFTRHRRAIGGAFVRLSLLWLIVYDAAWLIGAGLTPAAMTLLVLLLAAAAVSRLVATLAAWPLEQATYRV